MAELMRMSNPVRWRIISRRDDELETRAGHATIGAAALHTAREMLGLDEHFCFQLVSEEYDGESLDPVTGEPRKFKPQTLTVTEVRLDSSRPLDPCCSGDGSES